MALGSKIAYGREADVYAWGEDEVVKVFRPGFGGHIGEAAALTRLNGTGTAPQLISIVDVDGRSGLVMQRLHGVDMLVLLQKRPWRLIALARMLARAALSVHAVPAPPDLPDLIDLLGERITAADLDPGLRAFALRTLGSLPAGDRLCHGDLHPGNAVVTADGVKIIDWPGAARGTPAADVARSLLLLREADPLPGTPMLSRLMIAVGRSVFAEVFTRTYRRSASQPLHYLPEWTVVHAAARLSEGLPSERERLVGIVEAAYRAIQADDGARQHGARQDQP